jgi:hypothetical protein
LLCEGVGVDFVARACIGDLVCVTLPGLIAPIDAIAIAGAFGAALQARGVCAISPIAIAARHCFSAIEAGVSLPRPDAACAAGFGRQIFNRSDVLAVLCLPGWADDARIAVEIAEALAANRRVFLVEMPDA